MCDKNRADVEELNQNYIKGLTINYVSKMEDVINLSLLSKKVTMQK